MVMFETLRDDYRRHGRSLTEPAFVSLAVYRYGRWAIGVKNPLLRWLAGKPYALMKILILNVTKVWIPPQVRLGKDFHIIHAEGSLSIHPEVVIGDRCGVMHNVTIGTNMGPGAPVIGDDVFIGVNSCVLGPITIGDRVRIGANTAVTTNVPPDSVVTIGRTDIVFSVVAQTVPARPSMPADDATRAFDFGGAS